jgi:hypothetical protein
MRLSCLDSDRAKIIGSACDHQIHSCLNLANNKAANSLIQSPLSTQCPAMLIATHEKAAASRFRTRMTQISTYGESHTCWRRQLAQRLTRIFTDTCTLLRVHFFKFILSGRNSKILEILNNLYITSRLFNPARLKKLVVK